ncbi:MAG: hypothetical protein NTW17_01440 [Candidatus Pacearchaeota archaeon]|nr:hypothetical protein [Candidatus Pacearchaeota archaeon]
MKNKFLKGLTLEFKKDWKLLSFKLFLFASFLLICGILFFRKTPIFFISTYGFWILSFFIYEILDKSKVKDRFSKSSSIYILILNIIFFLMYLILFFLKFSNFTIYSFATFIFIFFLVSAIYSFLILIYSKKSLWSLIPSYVILAFLTIILFGYVFSIISAYPEQGLINSQNEKMNITAWDYVYFSSNNFYTMSYGDAFPFGFWFKLASTLELLVSFIIHIIILGVIITEMGKNSPPKINSFST